MRDCARVPGWLPVRGAGLAAAIALLGLASSGCASPGRQGSLPVADPDPADTASVAPARWPGFPLLPDGRFPIAAWCAPPVRETNDARYREYAEAGFTVVMPALEDPYLARHNLARLDVAGRQGLFAIVRDIRVHPGVATRPGWRGAVDSVAATYAGHPAMLGYFLADEPLPDLFGPLGAVARRLAMRDPLHPAYVNLFGEGSPGHEFQGLGYSAYVRGFVETVRPALFSLDNYVLTQDGRDIPTFDSGWDSARLAAGEVPFWAVLLLTPHGSFREPSAAELSWQANLALAHGARGIVWFTYWTPNPAEAFRYRDGPIAYDGTRNPSYADVAGVNAEVQALGRELSRLRCVDVRHSGHPPRGGRRLGADVPGGDPFGLLPREPRDLTFGFFLDPEGRRHVLVVNRDLRNLAQPEFVSSAVWEVWRDGTGRFVQGKDGRLPPISLPPGRAVLLRAAEAGSDRPPR